MTAPAILLKNASIYYQDIPLFFDLNLTFPAACCTCLLGRSGVGKSSLLRFIAGLSSIEGKSTGTVTDENNQSLAEKIAYMAQTDLLLPWLSVLENVLLGARLRNQRNAAAVDRAKQLLAQVNLEHSAHLRPAQLSGGMRQRVALARTLMEDHPIVLMDEPFSSLDAISRYQLQELAAQLLVNRTVLLVTHDPLEAIRLGHHIQVMRGSPAKLSSPITPVGFPPRNLSEGNLWALEEQLLIELAQTQEVLA